MQIRDDLAESLFHGSAEVRKQVKLCALHGARKHKAVRRKQEDEAQKARHHDLRDTLQALLKAEGADDKAENYRERHVKAHLPGIAEHIREDRIHRLMV